MYNEIVFSDGLFASLFSIVLVCILLPVFYLIYYTVKKKINLLVIVMGVIGFFVFGFLIEGLLLGTLAPNNGSISPAQYALTRCLCVGISEGLGAFCAMWIIRKKYDAISTPVSYPLGYTLISMLILGGANAFVRLGEVYTVNQEGINAVLASVQGEAVDKLYDNLLQLSQMQPYMYYFSAVDYICLFAVIAAVCRIVWYAIQIDGRGRIILAAAGLVFTALADLPVALFQGGATESYITCEIIRYAITFLCVGFAYLCSRRFDDKEKISAGPLNRKLL